MEIDKEQYIKTLKLRSSQHSRFPTELHELAWEIAVTYDEPYSNWVRFLEPFRWRLGQVKHWFNELQSNYQLKRKDRVRILMSKLK